jgi:spore germination protein YaaH
MMYKKSFRTLSHASAVVLLFSFVFAVPAPTLAASSDIEVSGWIPYWRTAQGTEDAIEHINQFTEVNPFAYSVRTDGTLVDTAKMSLDAWQDLIDEAEDNDVRVIPTIMWSDTANIHKVLSNSSSRGRHIDAIMDVVEDNDFDGIDIDYEGKRADTRNAYSAFIRELSAELAKEKKWLSCTVEARMPLSARFSGTPPANIEYANDLPTLNRYCDRVKIMTYDQQTADIELNREHAGTPYGPVADVEFVEKVVKYMDDDINRNKIMIGVPTYGNIYQLTPNTSGNSFNYIKTEAFNPRYGWEIAEEYDIEPMRGESGELMLTYAPKDNPKNLPDQDDLEDAAPKGTESALYAAEGALAIAKSKKVVTPIMYLVWSDAGAIGQKVELAEELGVAGIAIFKIDGGVDPDMWDELPASAPKLMTAPKKSTSGSTPAPTNPTTPSTPTTPTGNAGGSFLVDLEFGMESNDVLRLQNILKSQGYLTATPNGVFGPATRAAVIAWQRAKSLPATGFFGHMSRAKIGGSASAAPSSPTTASYQAQIDALLAQLAALQAQLGR